MRTKTVALFDFFGHQIILEHIQAVAPMRCKSGNSGSESYCILEIMFLGDPTYKKFEIPLVYRIEYAMDPDGVDRDILYSKDGQFNYSGERLLSELKAGERIMPVYYQLLENIKRIKR